MNSSGSREQPLAAQVLVYRCRVSHCWARSGRGIAASFPVFCSSYCAAGSQFYFSAQPSLGTDFSFSTNVLIIKTEREENINEKISVR